MVTHLTRTSESMIAENVKQLSKTSSKNSNTTNVSNIKTLNERSLATKINEYLLSVHYA